MFCLILSSCTKHKIYQQQESVKTVDDVHDDYLDFIIQQEAMLIDVPIPLFDERIIVPSSTTEDGSLVFGYKSPLSCDQAINFFMHQMERLGWKHLVSFDSVDIVLQFQSPNRYCTVIIKNNISSEHTSIFMYIKRASTDACPF